MAIELESERNRHLLPHHSWLIIHGIQEATQEIDAHVANCENCSMLLTSCVGRESFGEYLRSLGTTLGEIAGVFDRIRTAETSSNNLSRLESCEH